MDQNLSLVGKELYLQWMSSLRSLGLFYLFDASAGEQSRCRSFFIPYSPYG
jgi:hypothetical protein